MGSLNPSPPRGGTQPKGGNPLTLRVVHQNREDEKNSSEFFEAGA